MPIGDLKSYARNARTHSKAQIRQIADSLRGFGFVSPIVIDRDGTIIAGHGRVAAAKLIGRKTVPAVRADHLTDDQVKALRIADNRLAELAGWDSNLLALEFNDLLEIDLKAELSFDLAITGFAPAEIDRMVEAARENEDAAKDDAVPAIEEGRAAVSRLGDVFVLGDHRIICGDARSAATYAALMGEDRAVMGIHDAPYNVSVTNHVSRSGRHREFPMGPASGELRRHNLRRRIVTERPSNEAAFSA